MIFWEEHPPLLACHPLSCISYLGSHISLRGTLGVLLIQLLAGLHRIDIVDVTAYTFSILYCILEIPWVVYEHVPINQGEDAKEEIREATK